MPVLRRPALIPSPKEKETYRIIESIKTIIKVPPEKVDGDKFYINAKKRIRYARQFLPGAVGATLIVISKSAKTHL